MSVVSIGTGIVPLNSFSSKQEKLNSSSSEQENTQEVKVEQLTASLHQNNSVSLEPKNINNDLEKISLLFNKKLQYIVDQNSNEVSVKVIDRETDKVIRELPPEELQRLQYKLRETIGFLFDEQV